MPKCIRHKEAAATRTVFIEAREIAANVPHILIYHHLCAVCFDNLRTRTKKQHAIALTQTPPDDYTDHNPLQQLSLLGRPK